MFSVENIYQAQSPFWQKPYLPSSGVTFDNIDLHSIQSDGSQAQNTGMFSSLILYGIQREEYAS